MQLLETRTVLNQFVTLVTKQNKIKIYFLYTYIFYIYKNIYKCNSYICIPTFTLRATEKMSVISGNISRF